MRLSIFLRREWLSLMLGAIFGALVLSCIYGPLSPRDLLILRQHRTQLAAQRDRLLAENVELTERVRRLHSDDSYLQRLVRQELGYARADEFVYLFARRNADANR